jgi:GNAT superfamily N-acetyltransferase
MMIRAVKQDDLAALCALYEQLMDAPCDMQRLPAVFEKVCRNDNACVFGAFDADGTLMGSVYVVVCEDLVEQCRPFAVVENVVVDEKVRGKGVAGALMTQAEVFARERNCMYMMLVSGAQRKQAHGMYEHLGYDVPVRGFKKYLG